MLSDRLITVWRWNFASLYSELWDNYKIKTWKLHANKYNVWCLLPNPERIYNSNHYFYNLIAKQGNNGKMMFQSDNFSAYSFVNPYFLYKSKLGDSVDELYEFANAWEVYSKFNPAVYSDKLPLPEQTPTVKLKWIFNEELH